MAADFMKVHPEINGNKIYVYGKGAEGLMALTAGAFSDKINGVVAENILSSYISKNEFKQSPIVFVPNILKLADIQDIASLNSGKKLMIINAVNSANETLAQNEIDSSFSRISKIYRLLKAENNLKLINLPKNNIFNEIKNFLN